MSDRLANTTPGPYVNQPKLNILQIQDYIIEYDHGGYMTFKVYENLKSRPLPEEELRSSFAGYVEYLIYCFSLTGSLANLTRFPYLAYTYNGCSFLVQYLILVVLIGVPWCFMEIAVGQYSGKGPTAFGDMIPIGKGVAVAMGYICFLNVICYSPIQARCLSYMYWSLPDSNTLPWDQCLLDNSTLCITKDRNLDPPDCKSVGIDLRVTDENFYLTEIVNMDKAILYNGIGNLYGPLLLCLVISWTINYLLLTASKNVMKYVRIFGSIAPFALLAFFLLVIMTDDDAWGGFRILFDTSKINFLDLQSWRRAAEQVLYSLDVGTGHLIIYGKNSDFHNSILGGVLLVALLDTICAVAASLVVFGTANIVACQYHIHFNMVFESGPGMFFVAISHVIENLPFAKLLSFISFLILFIICILTQLSFLNPVIYLWNVYYPNFSLQRPRSSAGILCGTVFVLSLITVTNGGEMIISILDDIGSSTGILIITTFEAILIFGCYGVSDFCADLAFMSDQQPSIVLKLLFIGGPVFAINIMVACSFAWVPPSFQNVTYPLTMNIIAWVAPMFTLLIIMISAARIIMTFKRKKNLCGAFEPTDLWVPDLNNSLLYNKLGSMKFTREQMTLDSKNHLVFGLGKPKVCIKIDNATQTDEINYEQSEDVISNKRLQHFYIEELKTTNTPFEIERRHNETEILAWDKIRYTEHYIENGFLEKYCQTS